MDYLNELIDKQRTGTPKELASKIGLSERMLYRYIDEIRSTGKTVVFCRRRGSYIFDMQPINTISCEVIKSKKNVTAI